LLKEILPCKIQISRVFCGLHISTDVNKRVRAGQFKTAPRYTRDDCKLGGWGATLSVLRVR